MQTADICFFLFPDIEKAGKFAASIKRPKLEVF